MTPLVSTQWLADHLGTVRVVDASWYMPDEKRDAAAEFSRGHIPGAVFFDIDANSDRSTNLLHMLPSPDAFATAMQALGIGNDDDVVIYDGAGLFSAARLWWMLRVMGHDAVAVLDGGLPKWRAEGRALESGAPAARNAVFTAHFKPALLRDFAAVKDALGRTQILDARSPGRFTGAEKEPRAGLRSGHMPGAISTHYRTLLNADGTMKDAAALRTLFAEKGIDIDAPVITTCGSGVTAAIIALALTRIGARDVSLYDGSWSEWGGHPDALVEGG